MLVGDYMTPEPFTIHRDEPIAKAVDTFRHHGVYQIPVTDKSNRLVGILSERDVREAIAHDRINTCVLTVGDLMTPSPISVTPATPLSEAVEILSTSTFGAMPVVMGERIVGMISSRDLLRRLFAIVRERRGSMSVDYVHHGGRMMSDRA